MKLKNIIWTLALLSLLKSKKSPQTTLSPFVSLLGLGKGQAVSSLNVQKILDTAIFYLTKLRNSL